MKHLSLFLVLGLVVASCKSVSLDASNLESPMMLNSFAASGPTEAAAGGRSYTGTVSTQLLIHGFNGGGTAEKHLDNVQENAFRLIGGSDRAAITDCRIDLRSRSSYPLLFVYQEVEIEATGQVRNRP